MNDPVPYITFQKRNRTELEFEIFKLSSLFERRDSLDHRIDGDHRINFYFILFCTKGSGIHKIDFLPYPYHEGSILLVAKDQIQTFDSRFQSEGFVILFTETFLVKNVIHSDILFLHRLFNYHLGTPHISQTEQGDDNLSPIVHSIYNEYTSSKEYAKEALLRSYLKILLLKAERIKKRSLVMMDGKADWIDLFTRFKNMVSRLHCKTRNAKDYAARLGISYKHLNNISRYATGTTPKQFIDTYLVLEIKRMLTVSSMSVQELGYHFNFDEPTNFVKFFKKHTNQTPTQFRCTLKK